MVDNIERDYRSDPNFLHNVALANLMLSSGQPSQAVDAIFFHNRSFGDYTGLNQLVQEMYKAGRARFIAITNNEGERFGSTIPFEANPGKSECVRILTEEFNIPANRIFIPEKKHSIPGRKMMPFLSYQNSRDGLRE